MEKIMVKHKSLAILSALLALVFSIVPASAAKGVSGYQILKMEAGTWDADFPITGKDGKVQHLRAVQKNTLMAKGTWMLNDLYMPMSDPSKPRYHGHGVWTYNPATQRFEGTWVDQNFRSMRYDSGTYVSATSTLYWYGEQPDDKGHTVHRRFEEHFMGNMRELRFYTMGWKTGKEIFCGTLTWHRRAGSDKVNEDDTSTLP